MVPVDESQVGPQQEPPRRGGASPAGASAPPAWPRRRITPLTIALAFGGLGAAWVVLSDLVLASRLGTAAPLTLFHTAKELLAVTVTASLLYYLLRRYFQGMHALEEQVRAIIDGMGDAVLVVDGSFRIIDVNRAAVALYGFATKADVLGPFGDFIARIQARHGDGRPIAPRESGVGRALSGETVTGHEQTARRLDGKELFVSVTAAPVSLRPGTPPSLAVAVIRDISEVKRFEQMREEFLSTAAHEFKTPLAVVKAYAQLMQRRGQGDPGGLEVILRQIERLHRMVQQLLDVSRFRIGGGELRPEPFELGALLEEVVERMRGETPGHHIVLDRDGPALVEADRDRIAQVIAHLIENAARFSPQGGAVETAVKKLENLAVVSVRDHGLGIPPERQSRVFEPYYRAHAGTPDDRGGLALGLDMSREIVARHRGRIWFESAPGAGSTFFFSLPLSEAPR